LADSISKYIWNFEIYCGKTGNPHEVCINNDSVDEEVLLDGQNSGKGLGLQGRNVVKELMKDLTGQGHIVTTDNFYTSVPLFVDLLQNGIMATGTLRVDRKYIPKSMFAKSVTKNQKMGWLDYRMHRSRKISCTVWKDKKNVLLLSTHAEATSPPGTKQYVLRRVGGIK
jgi:hypothetical protein